MQAFSMWQPWATLWLNGPKIHETRGRRMNYRGWLAVHAAKRRPDKDLPRELVELLEPREGLNWRWRLPLGRIIGAVYVSDCLPTNTHEPANREDWVCGNWESGRYAIKREDVIKLPLPTSDPEMTEQATKWGIPGKQSLFYLPSQLNDWFNFHINQKQPQRRGLDCGRLPLF